MEAEDGLNGPIGKYTGNMSIFLGKEKKWMTRSKDGKSPSHSYIIDINILSR